MPRLRGDKAAPLRRYSATRLQGLPLWRLFSSEAGGRVAGIAHKGRAPPASSLRGPFCPTSCVGRGKKNHINSNRLAPIFPAPPPPQKNVHIRVRRARANMLSSFFFLFYGEGGVRGAKHVYVSDFIHVIFTPLSPSDGPVRGGGRRVGRPVRRVAKTGLRPDRRRRKVCRG